MATSKPTWAFWWTGDSSCIIAGNLLAIPVFLISTVAVGTRDLRGHILHTNLLSPYSDIDRYHQLWHEHYGHVQSLTSPAKQQTWDKPIVKRELSQLVERQTENYDMVMLLASASKHRGYWLHAIPISLCGLRHPYLIMRPSSGWWSHHDCSGIALGSRHLRTHTCVFGAMVDVRESHSLSCKRSSGRLIRHNHLNEIIHCSLTRAGIPAIKELAGLMRTDGKRLDELTLIPWWEGRCVIWGATLADTTAASYLPSTAMAAGSVTEPAAARKETKCSELPRRYEFISAAFEMHGSFCKKTAELRFWTQVAHIGHYN